MATPQQEDQAQKWLGKPYGELSGPEQAFIDGKVKSLFGSEGLTGPTPQKNITYSGNIAYEVAADGSRTRRPDLDTPSTGGTTNVSVALPASSSASLTRSAVEADVQAAGGTVTNYGGVLVATFPDGSSVEFQPQSVRGETFYNPGSLKPPVKADSAKSQSPAQKLWSGLPGYQGAAGAASTGSGTAPAPMPIGATSAAPRLAPGFSGAGYNPNEPSPGYDEGGNPIEGWGMINPSQGGFNRPLSLLQNVAQGRGGADFSQLASAGGLKATGNQAQDAENALAVTNQRALLASMGMSPLEVQRIFDARVGTGNPIKQNLNTGVYGAQTVGGNVSTDPRSSYGFGSMTSTSSGKSYPFNEEELQAMIRTGAIPSFAEGGTIGTNYADDDPRIGADSALTTRAPLRPYIFDFPSANHVPASNQIMARILAVQGLQKALERAGFRGGFGQLMQMPDYIRNEILGPNAQAYFANDVTFQPYMAEPRNGGYNNNTDLWRDALDQYYSRGDYPYRKTSNPVTIGDDGIYRQGSMPQPKGSYFDLALSSPTAPPQEGPGAINGPAPVVTPPPPPPPPVPAPYTGPAQLPFDAYRELGISSETDPFPRLASEPEPFPPPRFPHYAGGGQMMTQEPIVGVGMQSQRPQFVVGEAGPERLDVTPMSGPNAGNYAGGGMRAPVTPFAQLLEALFQDRRGAGRKPALKPVGAGMM